VAAGTEEGPSARHEPSQPDQSPVTGPESGTSSNAEAGVVRPARIVLDTSKAKALGLTCRSVSESYGLN
jgi:hypothetical protein